MSIYSALICSPYRSSFSTELCRRHQNNHRNEKDWFCVFLGHFLNLLSQFEINVCRRRVCLSVAIYPSMSGRFFIDRSLGKINIVKRKEAEYSGKLSLILMWIENVRFIESLILQCIFTCDEPAAFTTLGAYFIYVLASYIVFCPVTAYLCELMQTLKYIYVVNRH